MTDIDINYTIADPTDFDLYSWAEFPDDADVYAKLVTVSFDHDIKIDLYLVDLGDNDYRVEASDGLDQGIINVDFAGGDLEPLEHFLQGFVEETVQAIIDAYLS